MNRARLPSTVPPLPNASQTLLVILAERAGGGWGLCQGWLVTCGQAPILICYASQISKGSNVSPSISTFGQHSIWNRIIFCFLANRYTIITMTKRWMFITNDWYISFRHELPIPCALQIWDTSGKRNYLYVSSTERVSEITKFPLTALVIPTIWSAVKTRKSKRQIRTEWLSYVM